MTLQGLKAQPPFPSHRDREEKLQVMIVQALRQPRVQKTPKVTVKSQRLQGGQAGIECSWDREKEKE